MAYDKTGFMVSTTDPKGNVTNYKADSLGETLSITSPSGGNTVVASYRYDANGNLIYSKNRNGGSISTPTKRRTRRPARFGVRATAR